ncbi:hypothetical protein T484DRAFT_1826212 [Baffinella frigidus]|nr:hypothetical protein T484DRAFT_1826212 [Cryptophyta sp. CCMP2293]
MSKGGATILDFPSGALSRGDQFVNLHQMLKSNHEELPQGPVHLLQHVIHMELPQGPAHLLQHAIHMVSHGSLLSTTPRFVSRMDESPAKTMHDEYWHEHIDANQYPGFEYTALVYLNKQGVKPGGA